jgi:hypothetical protein
MQVILHIGTHKTGTSALQECLRRNERILTNKGIYYARIAPYKNSNGLAKTIAKTRGPEVKAFIDQHFAKAIALGAKTLLLSAESFYAMTMFFHKFNARRGDYWISESEAVDFLYRALPRGVSTRLIVCFRRQDYFLESIYREVVRTRGVAMPIDEFAIFFNEALDYWRHMKIWSAFFPDCSVYTYEQASNNISEFFFRNALHITNTDEFDGLHLRMNVRLSRDVLEYKRILNGMEMSAVDRYLSNLACTELARTLPDDSRYQDYLAPDAREALLREMTANNTLLSETFGMKPFPIISNDGLKCWSPYPGLSAKRAGILAARHAQIRKSAAYRIERSALLVREFIQERLPKLAWLIPLGRPLRPWRSHLSRAAIWPKRP